MHGSVYIPEGPIQTMSSQSFNTSSQRCFGLPRLFKTGFAALLALLLPAISRAAGSEANVVLEFSDPDGNHIEAQFTSE